MTLSPNLKISQNSLDVSFLILRLGFFVIWDFRITNKLWMVHNLRKESFFIQWGRAIKEGSRHFLSPNLAPDGKMLSIRLFKEGLLAKTFIFQNVPIDWKFEFWLHWGAVYKILHEIAVRSYKLPFGANNLGDLQKRRSYYQPLWTPRKNRGLITRPPV